MTEGVFPEIEGVMNWDEEGFVVFNDLYQSSKISVLATTPFTVTSLLVQLGVMNWDEAEFVVFNDFYQSSKISVLATTPFTVTSLLDQLGDLIFPHINFKYTVGDEHIKVLKHWLIRDLNAMGNRVFQAYVDVWLKGEGLVRATCEPAVVNPVYNEAFPDTLTQNLALSLFDTLVAIVNPAAGLADDGAEVAGLADDNVEVAGLADDDVDVEVGNMG